MGLTGLNRTVQLLLTNSSGSAVAQGDVVVLSATVDLAFTVTQVAANRIDTPGVVLEPNGIAAGSSGMVAVAAALGSNALYFVFTYEII